MDSDEVMRLRPGERAVLLTDSGEAVGYLSLITDEKGLERRSHCYRLDHPSHQIITGDVKVLRRIDPLEEWRKQRTTPRN